MKLKPYLVIAFLAVTTCYAQSSTEINEYNADDNLPKNEVSLNALYLILGAFEINYEYLLNEDSGVGISAMYTFDDDLWIFKHQITGYYRHYFGKKYAGGVYGEVFAMYNSTEEYYSSYSGGSFIANYENSHNFALGFGFGTKLISNKNLLLDAGLGLGRNIISSSNDEWLIPRFKIGFGYRF